MVYTFVGSILIALNPFKPLAEAGRDALADYVASGGRGRAPHCFSIAAAAHHGVVARANDQAVCISGEARSHTEPRSRAMARRARRSLRSTTPLRVTRE